MANTKSAKKTIRRQAAQYVQNLRRHRAYRAARKNVMDAISAEDKKAATKALTEFNQAVAKAAKHNGPLHQNTAARYMSRLAKKFNTAFAK